MSKHTGVLFIGFVIVAAIAVVVFVKRNDSADTTVTNTDINSINSNATVKNTVRPDDTTETVSADGAYTLLKPAEPTTVGEIVTYRFEDGNSLSIMPQALRSVVLNETPTITVDSDWPVSNIIGERYTLSSAKDGSEFYAVQVIYESELYDFRGSDDYLNNLSEYIKFTNNE